MNKLIIVGMSSIFLIVGCKGSGGLGNEKPTTVIEDIPKEDVIPDVVVVEELTPIGPPVVTVPVSQHYQSSSAKV